tara:strand:+ start:192578 stop:193627 length:1050 start_codon:yes stop_codon:yes gene_type:complete
MKRITKIALIAFVLLLAFIINIFISTGYFRKVENVFNGVIIKKIALSGAEDIAVSHSDDFALISATARKSLPTTTEEFGGLYYLNLKNKAYIPINLTADFVGSFAPHGITMIPTDSTYKVMAINHTPTGHSIEVFTLKNEELIHEKSLTDALMISPNDVVFIDENRFYFTNDHKYVKGIGRLLEDYAGLSVSTVIYFDGEKYREVADGIAYANGINYDKKRNLLYVASPRKFLVKVYAIQENGSLDFIENIQCKTGVDNIELDSEGNLWIGAHPNLLHFAAYAKGKEKMAPSEIIKVTYHSKGTYSIEQIYMNDGSSMSASTVAVPYKDLILTGNVMDSDFLILKQHKN